MGSLAQGFFMKGKGCSGIKTLAHVPGYRVDQCSCGLFHVCIGPVTVHMEPAAFLTFGDVMATSVQQILEPSTQQHAVLSLVGGMTPDIAES